MMIVLGSRLFCGCYFVCLSVSLSVCMCVCVCMFGPVGWRLYEYALREKGLSLLSGDGDVHNDKSRVIYSFSARIVGKASTSRIWPDPVRI